MARIKKKGQAGNAKNYITRSQAIRKLQISLPDFRRLCIFKGIYPREPRSRKKASKSSTPSTTFYYTKDIQYLFHEPLLNKFREQKALAKKISKALGRNEVGEAARFEKNLTPRIKLDHIIKERYPSFVDALHDLDDALCMLFLFANLPSTESAPPKLIARCQRLTMEFQHYLIRTHSLRKSFLSIKGIYYQATIQGQDILWLVPYRFVQRAGPDVDFRIMSTFVEFYATLLGFINFRLYTSIGLVYPPRFDLEREAQGAELAAIELESNDKSGGVKDNASQTDAKANQKAQTEADRLLATPESEENNVPTSSYTTAPEDPGEEDVNEENSTTLDMFTSIDPDADSLVQPSLSADTQIASRLFEPFVFYLSRETPRHPLEFVLKAFGCKCVGWDATLGDGAYCREDDSRITHQIVDRPEIPLPSPPLTDGELDEDLEASMAAARRMNTRVPGRIYIQPQWVWDSINAGQLQRPDLYAPGATLPPHLSPWVKPRKGEYDPTIPLTEQETEAEKEAAEILGEQDDEAEDVEQSSDVDAESDEREQVQTRSLSNEDADEEGPDMDVELASSSDEDEVEDDATNDEEDAEFGGFENDAEDNTTATAKAAHAHQADLEAEATGRTVPAKSRDTKSARLAEVTKKKKREEQVRDEELERRKMMLSRRKRKMYDKMVYSNARKDEEAEKLRDKRRKIENSAARVDKR